MDQVELGFWITAASGACWIICFWWMHRISQRQDALLRELREQSDRIEQLSKDEHDILKEVHPQISEIKERVGDVAEDVKQER